MTTGNAAAEGLKAIAQSVAPGWTVQMGLWRDKGARERYVVMRPIGGAGGGRLVRKPLISVMFIGSEGDGAEVWSPVVEAFGAALRSTAPVGVMYAEATEPTLIPTSDGRPVVEVVVSSIVSL